MLTWLLLFQLVRWYCHCFLCVGGGLLLPRPPSFLGIRWSQKPLFGNSLTFNTLALLSSFCCCLFSQLTFLSGHVYLLLSLFFAHASHIHLLSLELGDSSCSAWMMFFVIIVFEWLDLVWRFQYVCSLLKNKKDLWFLGSRKCLLFWH